MSALVVTETHTYRGDRAYVTPPDGFAGGLGPFLDRVSTAVQGVGVVLLDERAARRLGLPTDLPVDGAGKVHPSAEVARAAGWEIDEVYRWSKFRRRGQEIHIGLLGLLDVDYCPLIAAGPAESAGAAACLDVWQNLSGVPYRGDAGDAVNHILMSTAAPRLNGKPIVPSWRPRNPPDVGGAYARTFARDGFDERGQHGGRYLVGYDATRAYLSALSVVEVCPLPLRKQGRREFDPKLSGWWLVDLSPWTMPHMPAPWGYYSDGADGSSLVWLTTPDLVLLDQLHAAGRYGGYAIVDSYVGHADRAVMRPAAERLRAMWDASAGLDFDVERDAVRDTIRAGYHAMHGKWRSVKGNTDIHRPDWAAALVATARVNLWRRIDLVRRTAGLFPAFVNGIDTVYYATDDPAGPPPAGIVTARFPLNTGKDSDRLGTFRHRYTIDREEKG